MTNVIFDLDGTLVDSAPSILATYQAVLDKNKIEPLVPLTKNLIGPPLAETFSKLLGTLSNEKISFLEDAFKEIYDFDICKTTQQFAGILEVLMRLKNSGHRLFIVTNKRSRPTLQILQSLGWQKLFDDVYCIDNFTPKDDTKTRLLKALMERHALQDTDSIYIGDTVGDYQAAVSNKIEFGWVQWGYGNQTEFISKVNRVTLFRFPEDIFKHCAKIDSTIR